MRVSPQNTRNGLRPSQNTQNVLGRKRLGFQCFQCAAGGGFSVFSGQMAGTCIRFVSGKNTLKGECNG